MGATRHVFFLIGRERGTHHVIAARDRRSHPSNGFYNEIADLVQFQNEIGDVKCMESDDYTPSSVSLNTDNVLKQFGRQRSHSSNVFTRATLC